MTLKFLAKRVKEIEIPKSDNVLNKLKQLVMDSIGCLIGARTIKEGQLIVNVINFNESSISFCTIPGIRRYTSVENAVFINSYLTNLLDFDDTYYGHPGAVVIPSALAIAELIQVSGKEFLNAVLAGYEAAGFVGRSTRPSGKRFKMIRGSNTYLIFGATAATARLLGLNIKEIIQSLSIAAVSAPVSSTRKFGFETGLISTIKNHYGWTALGGLVSVKLAKKGFRADPTIFDGNVGFSTMIGSDQNNFSEEVLKIKSNPNNFIVSEVHLKHYPCCRYLHVALDSLKSTINDIHNLNCIKKIKFYVNYEIVNDFYCVHPKDSISSQFSLPHAAAMLVLGIEPGISWFDNDLLFYNKKVRDIREKVVICGWDLANKVFLDDFEHIAKTEVLFKDGSKIEGKLVNIPKGSPKNPMSNEDLIEKFTSLCSSSLGIRRTKELLSIILNLENCSNIRDLTKLLKKRGV